MDLKTVKLNCLTLGECGEMSLFPKKVEYPFKVQLYAYAFKDADEDTEEQQMTL